MPELHTKALEFGSVAASATWSHITLAAISHMAKPDGNKWVPICYAGDMEGSKQFEKSNSIYFRTLVSMSSHIDRHVCITVKQ